jgi:hypothetical protein
VQTIITHNISVLNRFVDMEELLDEVEALAAPALSDTDLSDTGSAQELRQMLGKRINQLRPAIDRLYQATGGANE